jgi:hypothetical protein
MTGLSAPGTEARAVADSGTRNAPARWVGAFYCDDSGPVSAYSSAAERPSSGPAGFEL